ncbi:hypothetical protein EIP86_010576 [Pleurotus ostreatoroseus]|nr:hypothetical protein EIP86_010576 [Pleurotus ostreatoroseus]
MALDSTQGSTWVYNTYVQPFFHKNEADLDAGILSAQTKTFAFVQSKIGGLWDALWRLATANGVPPSASQAQSSGPTQDTTQPPAGRANLYALGANLFHTYGPWAMGALSKAAGSTQAAPAAHTPGVSPSATPQSQNTPTPGMQQRKSYMSGEDQNGPAPSFPTPQHY